MSAATGATPTPRTTSAPTVSGTARSLGSRLGPPLGALVVLIVLWQLVVMVFRIPAYLLPGPLDVASSLLDVGSFVQPTLVTIQEAYVGFLIAVVVGVLAALVMGRWSILERAGYPYLILIQTLPVVAIAPLFVVWFGAGVVTNTLIAALLAVFPVAVNTLTGLKSTDHNLVQLFQMAGATKLYALFQLRIPSALPFIFTGLRIAAGGSVIGAVVGEFVAGVGDGKGGLGYVITESARQLLLGRLFAAAVITALVSILLFWIVTRIESLLLGKWHESAMKLE